MARERDEPVRLTRIYTRGGDGGETSLGDGSRVSKLDGLVRAYGEVDELNSLLGLAQVAARDERLARIQNELFDLGADLSVPYAEDDGKLRVDQASIDRLEHDCDDANAPLTELQPTLLQLANAGPLQSADSKYWSSGRSQEPASASPARPALKK